MNGGLVGPNQFVSMVSTAAARAFNIFPRKGAVAPGSDADVVVFDPGHKHVIRAATHHSAIDVNVYEGMEVTGKVRGGLVQGRGARRTLDCAALHGPEPSLSAGLESDKGSSPHTTSTLETPSTPTHVLRRRW